MPGLRVFGFLASLGLIAGCQNSPPVNRVPIVITVPGDRDEGEIGGMVVPVAHAGQVRYLAIDTGSALTFLYLGREGPEFRSDAGSVRIGSEMLRLPGRALDPDDETGIGIIGVLGADYFCSVPTLFDPVGATITRYHDSAAIPEMGDATEVPFENVEDHVIVRLMVDGRERRAMWDTGCPHLLLLGEPGRDTDERVTGQDVEGAQFAMYVGPASLVLPGEAPRTLTVLRVPDWTYFEGTVESLGGNIHGLAGQTVFGRRSMLFLPHRGVIRLGR